MASGCIIKECWVCNEWIWEDEDLLIVGEKFIHAKCKHRFAVKIKGIELQKKETEDIKDDLEMLKKMIESFQEEIKRLENKISRKS